MKDLKKLIDPAVQVTLLPSPVDIIPDRYERIIVQLVLQLTSLKTRITTTNQVEDDDYNSPDEDGSNVEMPVDLILMNNKTPALHLVNFPVDVKVIGVDNITRYLAFNSLW